MRWSCLGGARIIPNFVFGQKHGSCAGEQGALPFSVMAKGRKNQHFYFLFKDMVDQAMLLSNPSGVHVAIVPL